MSGLISLDLTENPITEIEGYKDKIFDLFPQLQVIIKILDHNKDRLWMDWIRMAKKSSVRTSSRETTRQARTTCTEMRQAWERATRRERAISMMRRGSSMTLSTGRMTTAMAMRMKRRAISANAEGAVTMTAKSPLRKDD